MAVWDRIKRELTFIVALRRILKWIDGFTPDNPRLLVDDIEAACTQFPDRDAIVFEGQTWTYRTLDARANAYAHWAGSIGLKAGDVVALFMHNRPDYIAIWYGLAKIGVVTALINHNLQGAALLHCITVAQSKAVIVGGEVDALWASIDGQLGDLPVWIEGGSPPPERDLRTAIARQPTHAPPRELRSGRTGKDACLYVYTSGTTGNPKAALLTHARVQIMSKTFISPTGTCQTDRVYCPLPLYHSTGGICGVGIALNTGAALVLRNKFSATGFWDDIVDQDCTVFVYIGELFRYLIATPVHPKERAHRLKACFGNGLRGDVWTRAAQRFGLARVVEFYGSTEGNVSFINVDNKIGAVGRIPTYMKKRFNVELVRFDIEQEAPVRNAGGFCEKCDFGEVGEAIGKIDPDSARGRFDGYANDTRATQKKLLHDVFEKGDLWFRTGDLLKQDKEGYFYFVDRVGDTYRWKSENVSTNEVSEALAAFSGIEQANVYGVDVPESDGRAGMAVIVSHQDLDMSVLAQHIRAELPPYAIPMFLRFQREVEVTGTFKYKKQELVKEGFDPGQITDPLFVYDQATQNYRPLTPSLYGDIQTGQFRL